MAARAARAVTTISYRTAAGVPLRVTTTCGLRFDPLAPGYVSGTPAKGRDVTTLDRQTQRKLNRLRESESRWLQKAAFALGKTREAREKLSEAMAEDLEPVITLDDGTTVTLAEVERHIRERVEALRSGLGEGNFRFGPG